MRTVLHLTVYNANPTVDWYIPTDNIAQIINSSPVQLIPIVFPANMPSVGGSASGIAVNESFSDIVASINGGVTSNVLTLTEYNVTPTQYIYVSADSVTSVNPSTSLGTIVNTDPMYASGSWGSGQFQVNETPADIAALLGTVVTP